MAVLEAQEFLTIKDIMRILKIGRNQAYALCKRPDFPCIQIGVQYRISQEEFTMWCEKQQKGNNNDSNN